MIARRRRRRRDPLHMKELAILVGLPGSGKTSFFRARLEATHAHVSKDLMGRGGDKGRRQLEEVARALRAGRSVAVDNVNARVEDRAALIALGRELGARVVAYVLVTPVRESLARNRTREGKARVPPVAVFVAAKRLQPPARGEGLDAVHLVRAEDGRFEVFPAP